MAQSPAACYLPYLLLQVNEGSRIIMGKGSQAKPIKLPSVGMLAREQVRGGGGIHLAAVFTMHRGNCCPMVTVGPASAHL